MSGTTHPAARTVKSTTLLRSAAFWSFCIFYFLLFIFFTVFDPFGLSARSKEISENIIFRLTAPLYASESQDKITVVLIDKKTLMFLGDDWPILYRNHFLILKKIIEAKPAALMIDVWFRTERQREIGAVPVHMLRHFEEAVNGRDSIGATVVPNQSQQKENNAIIEDLTNFANIDDFTLITNLSQTNQSITDNDATHILFARGSIRDDYICDLEKIGTPVITSWDRYGRRYPLVIEDTELVSNISSKECAYSKFFLHMTPAMKMYQIYFEKNETKNNEHLTPYSIFERFKAPLAIEWGSRPSKANLDNRSLSACFNRQKPHFLDIEAITGLFSRDDHENESRTKCPYSNTIMARDILTKNSDEHKTLFQNKYVFYGVNLPELGDIVYSPVHALLPGVYAHAMAFDNLITYGDSYYRDPAKIYKDAPAPLDWGNVLRLIIALVMIVAAGYYRAWMKVSSSVGTTRQVSLSYATTKVAEAYCAGWDDAAGRAGAGVHATASGQDMASEYKNEFRTEYQRDLKSSRMPLSRQLIVCVGPMLFLAISVFFLARFSNLTPIHWIDIAMLWVFMWSLLKWRGAKDWFFEDIFEPYFKRLFEWVTGFVAYKRRKNKIQKENAL